MVTIEELKREFGVRNIVPYGPCIVIPQGKLNIDWEKQLRDQGYAIHLRMNLPGGYECTVVELKPEDLEERMVYSPSTRGGDTSDRLWQPEEDQHLIDLWNKKLKIDEIADAFPHRTRVSIKDRLQRLRLHGTIQGRWRKGEGRRARKKIKESKENKPEVTQTSPRSTRKDLSSSTPARTQPSTPEDSLVSLLREIRDLLKPKTFYFDWACPKCNSTGSVCEEEKIWRFCPVCGKPLTVWNVEAS
jgi:hypothetical protein